MIIEYSQIPKLIESNLEVRTSRELLESSKLKVDSIIRSFIPEVSLYAKGENTKLNKLSKEPSAGVFTNINLFNGFRDVELSKINKINYEINHLEFSKNFNEIVFLTRKSFWQAIKLQENIKILNDYSQINKANRSLILKKVSSGLSPKSEELIFKKIDLELQEELLNSEKELRLVNSTLKNLLALSKNEPVELSASLDVTKYHYDINAKKLDMAQVEYTAELFQSEKKMSSLWRMPRINFYAEQSFTENKSGEILEENDKSNQLFGIKLTLPLLSEKNIYSIDEQVKKREVIAANLRKMAKIRERETILDKQEINLTHLLRIIEISKNKVILSKEILDKTFSEFKIGLKEAVSLNEATVEYVQAKKDLIEHQVDYILEIEQSKINVLN
ncbi:MAG: TolC family protein [Bacteriovorax sp.]|jgi:outer membrane protein TolC|nr:TolC family protein [Bacteriovorax sp.]